MQSTAAPDLTNELDSEVDKYEYIENGNLRIAVNNTVSLKKFVFNVQLYVFWLKGQCKHC